MPSSKSKLIDRKYIFLIICVLLIVGIIIFFVWKNSHKGKGSGTASSETLKLIKEIQENWTFDNPGISVNYGDLVKLETDYKTNYYSDIDTYNKSFQKAQSDVAAFINLYNALTQTGGTIPNIDEIKTKIDGEVKEINILLNQSPQASFQVLYDKTKALNDDLAKISPLIKPAIEGATKAQEAGQKALDSCAEVKKNAEKIDETQKAGKNILSTFRNSTVYGNIQTLIGKANDTLALIDDAILKTAEDIDRSLLTTARTKVEAIKGNLKDKLDQIENILTHSQDIADISGMIKYIQGKIDDLTAKKSYLASIDTNKNKLQEDVVERLKDLGLLQNVFDYGNQINTQYDNVSTFLTNLQGIKPTIVTPIPIPKV